MSTDEFWRGDPKSFWAYRFSFINKEKRKREYDNEVAWLNGLYMYKALSVSLSNMWCKNEKDLQSYFDKPIDFNSKPKSKEELIKQEKIKVENTLREQLKKASKLLKAGEKNG